MPYLTGHATDHDSAILWVNSAETWVDLYIADVDAGGVNQDQVTEKNVTYANFISESGVIDVLVFGSSSKQLKAINSPKAVVKKLSEISGFAPLPPINSLGFHFSKWDDEINAKMLTQWNT